MAVPAIDAAVGMGVGWQMLRLGVARAIISGAAVRDATAGDLLDMGSANRRFADVAGMDQAPGRSSRPAAFSSALLCGG